MNDNFPTTDLFRFASRCLCSGALQVLNIAHWTALESKAMVQCEDCSKGWLITVTMLSVSVNSQTKDRKKVARAKKKVIA